MSDWYLVFIYCDSIFAKLGAENTTIGTVRSPDLVSRLRIWVL